MNQCGNILWLIVSALAACLGAFFGSYCKKRAENLATKADIREITKKIEGVRHEFATDLFVKEERYKNEFHILSELSEKLFELRAAVISLRPEIDVRPSKDEEETVKKKRMERYITAFQVFYSTVEAQMPFYPEDIYLELIKFEKLTRHEFIEYKNRKPERDDGYWDRAIKNADEIQGCSEVIRNMIRIRVKEWEKDSATQSDASS